MTKRKFVMDEPDSEGFSEIRQVYENGTEGIIGWFLIDRHSEKTLFEKIILDSLNSHNYEPGDWKP